MIVIKTKDNVDPYVALSHRINKEKKNKIELELPFCLGKKAIQ